MKLNDLYNQFAKLKTTVSMPALFIGHGTPMNVVEDNEFVRVWDKLGSNLPVPSAILCISAHWETNGTYVTAMEKPKTIHDFYGFPAELYTQQYLALGNPELAKDIQHAVNGYKIELDQEWGLDHGTWSILKYLYPKADIPVLQLSIDRRQSFQYHYSLAQQLQYLRTKGVLIIGSGNMIHNLRILQVKDGDFNAEYGYDWAHELDAIFKSKIEEQDHTSLIDYTSLGASTQYAIPTSEHYIPLLYAVGVQRTQDTALIFNDKIVAGALSMTSVIFS